MTKWWVAGGIGVAALLGLLFWSSSASAAPKDDNMLKMKLAADTKKFYDAGFAAGSAQGSSDSGKPHNPIVVLDSEKILEAAMPGATADYLSAREQDFENGFNDGYEARWVAPTPVVVTKMDVPASPKPGGMKAGQSAYDYGFSRGKSTGYKDGTAGETTGPDYYLASDGSKARQIESGNPDEYVRGYKDGYAAGFASAETDKAMAAVLPTSSDTSTSGAPSEPLLSVAGILHVGADASASHILSIGYSPRSGSTLLAVAGRRVVRVRPAYAPPLSKYPMHQPPAPEVGQHVEMRRTHLGTPAPLVEDRGMQPHPLWPITT